MVYIISRISEGYICVHTGSSECILEVPDSIARQQGPGPAGALRLASQAGTTAPAHILNQITRQQVYLLLLSCTTVFATHGRRLGRVTSNLTRTRDDALCIMILRVNTVKFLGLGLPPAPAIPRISSK